MKFYVGIHMVAQAWRFNDAMISVNVLQKRKSNFEINNWMLDSGAFTQITRTGGFQTTPEQYAAQIDRWSMCGNLQAAVTQDYMCEPIALQATGLTLLEHQQKTIERFDNIQKALQSDTYLLPVLQGYAPVDYLRHLDAYGERIQHGAWTGVGSICKRNSNPREIEAVLEPILRERPDLRLHGFGIKTTALRVPAIRDMLHTADSMAWSFAARRSGRGYDANRWEEAQKFVLHIEKILANE